MLHLHITIAPILALKYLGTALESSAYILPSNLATIRPTRKIRLPRPRLTDKKKNMLPLLLHSPDVPPPKTDLRKAVGPRVLAAIWDNTLLERGG